MVVSILEKSHAASLPTLVGGYGRLAASRRSPAVRAALGPPQIGLDHRRVALDLGGRPLGDLNPMISSTVTTSDIPITTSSI